MSNPFLATLESEDASWLIRWVESSQLYAGFIHSRWYTSKDPHGILALGILVLAT